MGTSDIIDNDLFTNAWSSASIQSARSRFIVIIIIIQGGSNMTGTDLCVNWTLIVPVIFEPPCIFKLQMGFYPLAVYYNKTQHTNNTHHTNKHSTQNYTNNKGHTTHNECNTNTITTTINTSTTTIK
jgi:hypothetical protein